MGDTLSDDDRLPWLDTPSAAEPTPAARRVRTPLLGLLGLFCFGAIVAMMGYLIGRSTTPVATTPREVSARVTSPVAPAPAPTPVPTAPIALPTPVVLAPAPVVVAPPAPPVAESGAIPSEAEPKATVRPSMTGQTAQRTARAVDAQREADRAPGPSDSAVPQDRTLWQAQPFAGPRGRVIQLGAYPTQAQADAAWWRAARAYPVLATLPRVVAQIGPWRPGSRYYHIRLAARSTREASALCSYLHRIRRGCIIV